MKGKLLSLAAVAALAIGFASSGAHALSAKFAASWSNEVKIVHAYVDDGTASACLADGTGTGTDGDPCVLAEALLTTIDVAQQKDLLIGVSGQIGLHTFTQAKGKGGSSTQLGEAKAVGSVVVTLELREAGTSNFVQTAAPGPVIFAARLQELKVAVADSDMEDLTEVIVSLLLQTTAAHHFNFIGVDLDQGVYDVVAIFNLSAWVAIVGEDAIAEAIVTLGPRMVTAKEVRTAKNTLVKF
jgi:hypothetical protein